MQLRFEPQMGTRLWVKSAEANFGEALWVHSRFTRGGYPLELSSPATPYMLGWSRLCSGQKDGRDHLIRIGAHRTLFRTTAAIRAPANRKQESLAIHRGGA
jgi:hypothetical protein